MRRTLVCMATSRIGPPRPGPEPTLFEAVGGVGFFERLVAAFYRRVEADSLLLGLYPDPTDLDPARERLTLFLIQYWGGPTTYSERRGHPRLRMRHMPFVIGDAERDHWVAAMQHALDATMGEIPLDPELQQVVHARMSEYFTMSAAHLVNQPD